MSHQTQGLAHKWFSGSDTSFLNNAISSLCSDKQVIDQLTLSLLFKINASKKMIPASPCSEEEHSKSCINVLISKQW